MLCVIPFYSGDLHLAKNLANWIAQLGGVSNHDCLLIVDKSTTSAGVIEPLRKAFKSVTETSSEPVGDQGKWGNGTTNAEAPNEMFLSAYTYVLHKLKCRWFWLETDAVPMRPTWLDEIEAEDKRGKKPFMGAYVDIPPHEPHMSGIAVYPPNVPDHSLKMATPGPIAWDYAGRSDTVGKGKAHFTSLIQHEYRIHGESPTFPTPESLGVIKPGTAVFHRCKDFTLIDRLRENLQLDGAIKRITSHVPAPSVPKLVDLRGYDATHSMSFSDEPTPIRLQSVSPATPQWHAAVYEIRTVTSSKKDGILPGDKVLFSRCVNEDQIAAEARCQNRLAPALAAAAPMRLQGPVIPAENVPKEIRDKHAGKKKKPMSEATKAKLRASWEKRKKTTLL